MKKCSEETQTLRSGCSKVEPNFFVPPQTPFLGWPKFNQLEMDLYLQTQFGGNRCTQFRVIMVTDPPTHTHPQTGPITIHCAAAFAQCNDNFILTKHCALIFDTASLTGQWHV